MAKQCFFSDETTIDRSQPQSFQTNIQNSLISQLHVHNYERWFGAQSNNVGPGSQNSLTPYQVTSSATANTFGSVVNIFTGVETPTRPGMNWFDMRRIQIIAAQNNNKTYRLRLANNLFGETTFAQAVANGNFTDIVLKLTTSDFHSFPFEIQTYRLPAGSLIWAAVATADNVSQYIAFLVGLHEYQK
jgi:hypothetical protein